MLNIIFTEQQLFLNVVQREVLIDDIVQVVYVSGADVGAHRFVVTEEQSGHHKEGVLFAVDLLLSEDFASLVLVDDALNEVNILRKKCLQLLQ